MLENAPLRSASAKAEYVRTLVAEALAARPADDSAATIDALEVVLGNHQPAVPQPRTDAKGRVWPASLSAACVHADGYGTRSGMIASVPASATGVPQVLVADGRPCEAPMQDMTGLWAPAVHRS